MPHVARVKNGTCEIVDASTGVVRRKVGPMGRVRNAYLSDDGRTVLLVTKDNRAILYKADTGSMIRTIGPIGKVEEARFCGEDIMIKRTDGKTEIYNARTGSLKRSYL